MVVCQGPNSRISPLILLSLQMIITKWWIRYTILYIKKKKNSTYINSVNENNYIRTIIENKLPIVTSYVRKTTCTIKIMSSNCNNIKI